MQAKRYHPPHIYLDDTEYFITASTFDRVPLFASNDRKTMLRDLLREKIQQYGVKLFAWVILNDHYHLLMHIGDKKTLYRFLKSLHGESAIRLNKEDARTGRRVWRNYWDRCPRSEKDFYTFFNYIHINPVKHYYVRIGEHIARVEGNELLLALNGTDDFHDTLVAYPFSSYAYYARKYGKEGMINLWFDYPLVVHLEWDNF